MTKKQKAALAVAALEKAYPEAICSLKESEPYRLLIAVRLSAQCTDARVNLVTPVLFERFPTLESLAFADVSEVEEIVHPCGFFRAKANDIVAMSRMLIEKYNSKVPDTIEELVKLPGVGRKTANLIVGDVYGKPAVVADTHLIRITNLLGLVDTKDPAKVEKELKALLDPEKSNDFCHRCVLHGRAVCIARRPNCPACVMNGFCGYYLNKKKNSRRHGCPRERGADEFQRREKLSLFELARRRYARAVGYQTRPLAQSALARGGVLGLDEKQNFFKIFAFGLRYLYDLTVHAFYHFSLSFECHVLIIFNFYGVKYTDGRRKDDYTYCNRTFARDMWKTMWKMLITSSKTLEKP